MVEPSGNQFLADLESKSKGPNYFFRTMANRPKVLEGFVPLYGRVPCPPPGGGVSLSMSDLGVWGSATRPGCC